MRVWSFTADARWLVASATVMSLAPWLCGAVAESTKAAKAWTIRQFARERRPPTNFTMQHNVRLCLYLKQM
jgi:hypothetical protein